MFICWGELLWDLFPSGPELGGAAANVAINLKRLGARPLLVSRVGNDPLGEQAIDTLERLGLDSSYVQRDATAPTGTVNVDFVDGEPQYRISTQAAWDRLQFAPEQLPPAIDIQAIVYGTLAQRTELVRSSLRRLLESRTASCWSVCDLNLRPPFITRSGLDEAIAHADALKMNESELQTLGDLLHVTDPVSWLFANTPVRVIAVTRQARGCSLFDRNTRVDHPGFPRLDNGDSVGAGDAFCATFAYHLVNGSRLQTIAEAANDHARRVASARGAFGFVASGPK
jgi:fructokinase